MTDNDPRVSRRLLGLLGAAVVLAAFVAQRNLGGGDDRGDVGFDGGPAIALVDDDDELEIVEFTRPANPRNPFEPFLEFDLAADTADDETAEADEGDSGAEDAADADS